jgi:hypothetical protein
MRERVGQSEQVPEAGRDIQRPRGRSPHRARLRAREVPARSPEIQLGRITMDKQLRRRRDTAIVTSRLAGEPAAEVADENEVAERTIRRVMERWRAGELELCPEMGLRIRLALRALEMRLVSVPESALDVLESFDLSSDQGFKDAELAADYLRLSGEFDSEEPRPEARPDIDWAYETVCEINLEIRELMAERDGTEELVEEVTETVFQWFNEKWDYRLDPRSAPWVT